MTNWKNRAFSEKFDSMSEHMQLYPDLYEEGVPIEFEKYQPPTKEKIKIPEIKSKWKHYNGIEYKVINIANEDNTEKYPTTVVYKGKNGKVWSRFLSDWYRSFTEIKKQK